MKTSLIAYVAREMGYELNAQSRMNLFVGASEDDISTQRYNLFIEDFNSGHHFHNYHVWVEQLSDGTWVCYEMYEDTSFVLTVEGKN